MRLVPIDEEVIQEILDLSIGKTTLGELVLTSGTALNVGLTILPPDARHDPIKWYQGDPKYRGIFWVRPEVAIGASEELADSEQPVVRGVFAWNMTTEILVLRQTKSTRLMLKCLGPGKDIMQVAGDAVIEGDENQAAEILVEESGNSLREYDMPEDCLLVRLWLAYLRYPQKERS